MMSKAVDMKKPLAENNTFVRISIEERLRIIERLTLECGFTQLKLD
jgi:hypothetical protein